MKSGLRSQQWTVFTAEFVARPLMLLKSTFFVGSQAGGVEKTRRSGTSADD
jgi:hypothetical protein